MTVIRTACPYCGTGCGVTATVDAKRNVTIAGDKAHNANAGKLCSKGTYLGETLGHAGRLLAPMIGERAVDWDTALNLVARRFADIIAAHGPDSVAFYVSGQLLTEDYYVFNKLMKGYIGSANIDTNSRLCMASAVSAHVRAFGEDVVPACYDDIEAADLAVVVGSNTAWCHPVLWQRLEAARERRGTKIVVIDPRRTETAERADLHVPLRAGSDVTLFNGLLSHLSGIGAIDSQFLARHVNVPPGFWSALGSPRAEVIAAQCDVPEETLATFFKMFAETPRTVTFFSMGVNQSVQGTDKANAIINCHLATGRIGRPGAAPFSLTGQPNAMGGREVGGLANTLAAHMDFAPENVRRVGRFWGSARVAARPGLKAVDMFRAVADGRIKAIWIAGTNPAVSMPNAGFVREALARCPFVVVSEVMADTDTARLAHVRLPAAAWGEKNGTVTNSERCITRQRSFLPLPGKARPDWWMAAQVAVRLGYGEAFAWQSAAAVFREHAALTAFENNGTRMLDLTPWIALSDVDYDKLKPARWGGLRPFARKRFPTSDGRARMVSVISRTLANGLVLNTGRYRDQWHTMTRTGVSATLSQHRREPLVEVHPEDAAAARLTDGDLVQVETAMGASIFRLAITADQRRGEVFVPMHWGDQQASGGRAGLLTLDTTDPVSGQPGLKLASAALRKMPATWHGFLVTQDDIGMPDGCLWATRATLADGALWELAGTGPLSAFDLPLPEGERVELHDSARGTRRVAVLVEGRLRAALFLSEGGALPPRTWLASQLGQDVSGASVLAGKPAYGARLCETPVCLCFNLGENLIRTAIARDGLGDVASIGRATGAGTNCGSCRPTLARFLAEVRMPAHAAE